MSRFGKVSNNVHTLNDWIDAFRGRDIPKMVSLLTDDVKINSIIFQNYEGKDGATKYWQKLFTLIPTIGIDIVTLTANEERIVAEIDVSGMQKGKVGSSSPGLEKKFQVRGAFVYEFSDNVKIREIRMYYDSDMLKKQTRHSKLQLDFVRKHNCFCSKYFGIWVLRTCRLDMDILDNLFSILPLLFLIVLELGIKSLIFAI